MPKQPKPDIMGMTPAELRRFASDTLPSEMEERIGRWPLVRCLAACAARARATARRVGASAASAGAAHRLGRGAVRCAALEVALASGDAPVVMVRGAGFSMFGPSADPSSLHVRSISPGWTEHGAWISWHRI